MSKLILVGTYKDEFNSILNINIDVKEIYQSKGLLEHMRKRKHNKCIKYINDIPDIIDNPDYIGVNPNEKDTRSIELVKRYKDNVLVGIKLDKSGDYLYVATLHDIQESKIQRRLHSGRLKKFSVDNDEEK